MPFLAKAFIQNLRSYNEQAATNKPEEAKVEAVQEAAPEAAVAAC